MTSFVHLVLFSMVLAAVRTASAAAGSCEQPKLKRNVCRYITNCIRHTKCLSILVKDNKGHVAHDVYNLQEPENVTSIDDFCQEMITYKSILSNLRSSMNAYLAASETEVVVEVTGNIKLYQQTLNRSIEEIGQTVEQLKKKRDTKTNQTTLSMPILTERSDIYRHTVYVTDKLNALLQSWITKCDACRRLGNGNKKIKNKVNDKTKVKGEGKGKGKEKTKEKGKGKKIGKGKRNRVNKNKKSHEKTTQQGLKP